MGSKSLFPSMPRYFFQEYNLLFPQLMKGCQWPMSRYSEKTCEMTKLINQECVCIRFSPMTLFNSGCPCLGHSICLEMRYKAQRQGCGLAAEGVSSDEYDPGEICPRKPGHMDRMRNDFRGLSKWGYRRELSGYGEHKVSGLRLQNAASAPAPVRPVS